MSDFHQNGHIATLHNLTRRPVEEMERELVAFGENRPISLILPSLFSELEGDALPRIVDHLEKVPYLKEIIIGLDRADEAQFAKAKEFFSRLPQHHRILWNDGPRLSALHDELVENGVAPTELGKGRNVWYCMGYALASGRSDVVALHDCDIVTYDREMLARLVYPVANPRFGYVFAKGFYSRIAEGKLNGRVCRLLVGPLLNALERATGKLDLFSIRWVNQVLEDCAAAQGPFRGVLASLRFGEHLAAVEMGIAADGVYHSWFPAYDPAFAKASPGLQLLEGLALHAQTLGLTRIDLGKGEAAYKRYYADWETPLFEGRALAPGFAAARVGGWEFAERAGRALPGSLAEAPAKLRRRWAQTAAFEPDLSRRLARMGEAVAGQAALRG